MTYLKITNLEENHNGLQYKDGLVEDIIPFAKEGSCVPGGIYFSDDKNICGFLEYGEWIREVTIPSDAEMVEDPDGGKWRSSKVILGERKSLLEVSTWEWMISIGWDVHSCNEGSLRWACRNGHLEVAKYLISVGADIHCNNNIALIETSSHGNLEVVKFLVSQGADIHTLNEWPLKIASIWGHLEVVKYLVSVGADVHANEDIALREASHYGHLEVVKFLESCK
jgi:hypothetical protein